MTRDARMAFTPRTANLEKSKLFCEIQTRAARKDANIRLALAEIAIARAALLLRRTRADDAPYGSQTSLTEVEPTSYNIIGNARRKLGEH
jgi:hypothetical protein